MKFVAHQVEKPWGRVQIPAVFGPTNGSRIGEIWFEPPRAQKLPLLAKYIFTSEKLSVQVHPDDTQAAHRGLERGKSECWYILDAEPGATLGLGLRDTGRHDEIRAAALDGSIEGLMDWKPVTAGDFFFVPPGTIHAIGAGITLLEFQQNADVTYRLYDYGRPRELHLDDGLSVAKLDPYPEACVRRANGPTDVVLSNRPEFSLLRISSADGVPDALSNRFRWLMPLEGLASSCGEEARPGECLLLEPEVQFTLQPGSVALIGAEGSF